MKKDAVTVALRQWREDDLQSFVALNCDPDVMRYFPGPMTREQSEAGMRRQMQLIEERGWGFWAVEADGVFAGFTGLNQPQFELPFAPCVEIGWRIHRDFWGRGVAFRAAQQALSYGFATLRLPEIVAFTAVNNQPSRRLMERLGFVRDIDGDFDHPLIGTGHDLRRHVLYRKVPPF